MAILVRTAALLCLLGLFVSCGGDGPSAVAPSRTPVLLTSGEFTVQAPTTTGGTFFGILTGMTQSAGTWEATIDWTSASNTLWMYVTNGACTPAQFSTPQCASGGAGCACPIVVRSQAAAPKPRVLTIPNAPAATRSLIIVNLGPEAEAGIVRITLTPN